MTPITLEIELQDYSDASLYAELLPGQVSATAFALLTAQMMCNVRMLDGGPDVAAWSEHRAIFREARWALPYRSLRPNSVC